MRIAWPHQVESGRPQGKWLLYLAQHPLVKNGAGSCALPSRHSPNPLGWSTPPPSAGQSSDCSAAGLSDSWGGAGRPGRPDPGPGRDRPRRELERIAAAQVEGPGGDRVVRLDCDRGTAKCLQITCQVYNLRANASFTIEVRARLWNATLVEDYSDVARVLVVSRATVLLDPVYTQDTSNDYMSVTTLALPDLQREPERLSWWIYVVAAVSGILLLLVISLILKKLGFFNRKRVEDDDFLMSANFEKARLNGDAYDH